MILSAGRQQPEFVKIVSESSASCIVQLENLVETVMDEAQKIFQYLSKLTLRVSYLSPKIVKYYVSKLKIKLKAKFFMQISYSKFYSFTRVGYQQKILDINYFHLLKFKLILRIWNKSQPETKNYTIVLFRNVEQRCICNGNQRIKNPFNVHWQTLIQRSYKTSTFNSRLLLIPLDLKQTYL